MPVVVEKLETQARKAMCAHAADCAREARARYGDVDYDALCHMLHDPRVVRYPTQVRFSAEALQPGEFAHAEALGGHPRDGFRIFVHPHFAQRPQDLPLLVAYHLVCVNYGGVATREVAEAFGAALLGMSEDEYYRRVCRLADEIAEPVDRGG